MNKHVDIKIYGDVQGVSFRWYTRKQARKLGLMGFVRNEPDGSVYVEVEGDSGAVEKFLVWCKKGPMFASISKVESAEAEMKNYPNFEIRL